MDITDFITSSHQFGIISLLLGIQGKGNRGAKRDETALFRMTETCLHGELHFSNKLELSFS